MDIRSITTNYYFCLELVSKALDWEKNLATARPLLPSVI